MTAAVVALPLGRIPRDAPRAEVVDRLRDAARALRARDAVMVHAAGNGHLGGDFSLADVLVTLVLHELDLDPGRPEDPERDRLILSKGHAAGALYIALAMAGFFDPAELDTFLADGSRLNGHPNRLYLPGVEANTGPLGHGLPIAVGTALAAQLDGSPRRTVVLLGDGELQEGSNWEAMMAAAHFGLSRLTIVVDRNRLQQGAAVADTMSLGDLAAKGAAFGLRVLEVDAHDHDALLDAFATAPDASRPTLLIAHSHKGHPISFMSDRAAWHHHVPDEAQLAGILTELEPR